MYNHLDDHYRVCIYHKMMLMNSYGCVQVSGVIVTNAYRGPSISNSFINAGFSLTTLAEESKKDTRRYILIRNSRKISNNNKLMSKCIMYQLIVDDEENLSLQM